MAEKCQNHRLGTDQTIAPAGNDAMTQTDELNKPIWNKFRKRNKTTSLIRESNPPPPFHESIEPILT